MAIRFECPHCLRKIKGPDNLAGHHCACPGCGEVLTVPTAEEPPVLEWRGDSPYLPTLDTIQEKQQESAEDSRGAAYGWWRWPLIPILAPAGALAVFYVATLFAAFVNGMYWAEDDGNFYRQYIQPMVLAGLLGVTWCKLSMLIAPRGKVIAGSVMATVLGMLMLAFVAIVLSDAEVTTAGRVVATMGAAGAIAGSVLAVVSQHEVFAAQLHRR